MSVQTIKGSRQKNATGNYADYIPFGTDGEYVDMLSGLNLERELKLGGDHLATIEENAQGNTVITEKYATNETTKNYYKVITTISEQGNTTTIISVLHWIDNSETDIVKKTKTVTISEGNIQTDITEVLS